MRSGPLGLEGYSKEPVMRGMIRTGAVCLLLGLLTTVAVATGLGLLPTTSSFYRSPNIFESKASCHWLSESRIGATEFVGLIEYPLGSRPDLVTLRGIALRADYTPLPGAFAAEIWEIRAGHRSDEDIRFATWGFPFRALWGWQSFHKAAITAGGDWRASLTGKPARRDRHIYPFLPMWPGLLGNTAIYAFAWFALSRLSPATRRAVRRRRGQCPKCGYNLAGLAAGAPCPECGTGRSGSTAPSRTPLCAG